MRILVTGAGGIIGTKLVDTLRKLNYHVTLLVREKRTKRVNDPSDYVIGDILHADSLYKATENIDCVIHLAGITHTNNTQLYYDVNTKGTKNLIKACTKNKIKRFIYISTRAASLDGGAYAHSKLLAEKVVKRSLVDWIILRLAEVYGAGEKESIARLVKTIQKSYFVPILGDGQYTLAPVYVEDVISAIIISIQTNISKKIYTIAGPVEITYNQLVDTVLRRLRVKRIKIYIPVLFLRIASLLLPLFNIHTFVRDQIPRLLCKKSSEIKEASRDLHFFPIKFEIGLEILLGSLSANAENHGFTRG